MAWIRSVLPRLRALFRKGRFEMEMHEEFRFHLQMMIQDNIQKGMSPKEARRTALLHFGGVDKTKDECRDASTSDTFHRAARARQDARGLPRNGHRRRLRRIRGAIRRIHRIQNLPPRPDTISVSTISLRTASRFFDSTDLAPFNVELVKDDSANPTVAEEGYGCNAGRLDRGADYFAQK